MKSSALSKFVHVGMTGLFLVSGSIAFAESNADTNNGKPPTEVKVRELNKNPGKFAGDSVVVSGKVDRVESPNAFIIEGSGIFNNKILAIVDTKQTSGESERQQGGTAPVVKEKQKLQVTGKVIEMGVTKIEEKYSPLKAEVKAEFEGNMPVLLVPPSGIKVQS